MSSAIVVGSTNSNDISVSGPSRSITRSSSSTSCARRTQRGTSTVDLVLLVGAEHRRNVESHAGRCAHVLRELVAAVRVDDVLHDAMPHDVARAELDEHQPVDAVEHVAHLQQPGTVPAVGKVDLGHVAGHDRLRTEAEPGQEHLHLLGRGVLRLVEDDERVVERPAAHVRERRDLDRAPLHQARDHLGLEHVVAARRRAGAGTDRPWRACRRAGSRVAPPPRPPAG